MFVKLTPHFRRSPPPESERLLRRRIPSFQLHSSRAPTIDVSVLHHRRQMVELAMKKIS